MADISKVTLVNGQQYDIKDTTARESILNLANSVTIIYSTVADMKADAANFYVGEIVLTRGYYTSGDGGGAYYKIWKGTATDFVSIQLTDTLAAYVVRDGNNFNVLQYGVKGDGTTDVTDIVNQIFQQVPHDSTIYFPAGEYKFTAPIIPNRLAAITGDVSTIFKDNTWISQNTSGTIFNFDVSNMPNYDDYSESDYGTTITYNDKTYKLDYDGISFINYGLTSTGRMGVNIENIYFNCNAYDVDLDTSQYIVDPDKVFVLTITKPKINCLKLGENTTIKNCTFIGWSGYALTSWDRWNSDGYPSWSAWNHVDRCYFEHCKYGILSAIDSQFMNLRFNECYTGIINNGSANLFLNIRMDSIGMNGIKMQGSQCGSATIIGLNIDVGYGPGLVVHGDNHYIQGLIGRCGGKSTGKSQSEVTYLDFEYSCDILLDDDGTSNCKNNKIDVVLNYGPVYLYADADLLAVSNCPAFLVGMTHGDYENIGLNITSTQTIDNSSTLFTNILMALSAALNAPDDAGSSFLLGHLIINGDDYCALEKIPYPFDRDSVTLNNFFMGFGRSATNRPPTRLGTFMEHYWNDRYCMSIYNSSTSKYEWVDIKNPAIDTSLHEDNATASAKETGTELSILRQRVGNIESALSASNITDIDFDDSWKSIGTSARSDIIKTFTDLDLENNEIEIKVDLTNVTADNKPSNGTAFIRFIDGTKEFAWNSTGWIINYAGLNTFQSFTSDLYKGTSIWGNEFTQDWSKKLTIRINRQGISINNIPVQVAQSNQEVQYRDTIKNLISNMISVGSYYLYICGNLNVIVESIKLINYNIGTVSLGDENNIETISVDDLKSYIGI